MGLPSHDDRLSVVGRCEPDQLGPGVSPGELEGPLDPSPGKPFGSYGSHLLLGLLECRFDCGGTRRGGGLPNGCEARHVHDVGHNERDPRLLRQPDGGIERVEALGAGVDSYDQRTGHGGLLGEFSYVVYTLA